MNALNAISIATRLVAATATNVIVLELYNGGSSSRWARQFPSLDAEHVAMLDQTTFLEIASNEVAIATFGKLIDDCVDNGAGGVIYGIMTLVTAAGAIAWDLASTTRPVLENGEWRQDVIADRL